MTEWMKVKRTDPRAIALADGHYSRIKYGKQGKQGKQLGRNCRTLVFITPDELACWVVVWPDPRFAFHGKGDAWECSLYHRSSASPHLASDLIFDAVEETAKWWGAPPSGGYITTVDPAEVKSRNPGYCFICAGWQRDGTSSRGLLWFRLPRPAIVALTSD